MRREKAGCDTWRNSADRLKLRVSASEAKFEPSVPCGSGAAGGGSGRSAFYRPPAAVGRTRPDAATLGPTGSAGPGPRRW
jgi:hypothetical protein